jgi:beta-lactamase class A
MTIVMLTALLVSASQPSTAETLKELKGKLDKIAEGFRGTMGYSLHYRGKHDERIEYDGDETFPTASTIKTAVMCEAMHQIEQGKVKWTQKIPVPDMDYRQEGGGYAHYFIPGTSIPLGEWVNLMIMYSDNTATMNLREFLGQKNVNDWLAAHRFRTTRLLNGKKCDELGLRPLQQKWGLGMTTPNEMVKLFELILDNKAGSRASCERMQRILSRQYWDDLTLGQIPPSVRAGSKTGAVDQSRSEVVFVDSPGGQYVFAAYTKDQQDERWVMDNEGDKAIRAMATLIWKHYNPKDTWQPPKGWDGLMPS